MLYPPPKLLMVDVGIYGVRSRLGKLSAPLWGQFEVQGGSEAVSEIRVLILPLGQKQS